MVNFLVNLPGKLPPEQSQRGSGALWRAPVSFLSVALVSCGGRRLCHPGPAPWCLVWSASLTGKLASAQGNYQGPTEPHPWPAGLLEALGPPPLGLLHPSYPLKWYLSQLPPFFPGCVSLPGLSVLSVQRSCSSAPSSCLSTESLASDKAGGCCLASCRSTW